MTKPPKSAAKPVQKKTSGASVPARPSSAKPPVAKGKGPAAATAAAHAPSKAAGTTSARPESKAVPKKAPPTAKPPVGKKVAAKVAAAPAESPAEPRKWPKGGPGKADLKRYRDRLLEMRRALVSSSKELATEALKSSGSEFSVDHMADHGSDNYEQDFSLQLLEGEAAQLADINDALAKIDGKAELPFGICEACVDDAQRLCPTCPWIPSTRLDVIPHARLCVQTKELDERRNA